MSESRATRDRVLQQAGFRCGNPGCRAPLALDAHVLAPVVPQGAAPDELIALCVPCDTMHAGGVLPLATLRAWKRTLEALHAAFGPLGVDTLLLLHVVDDLPVQSEGLLQCAGLLTSGLIEIRQRINGLVSGQGSDTFKLRLSERGRRYVQAWMAGRPAAEASA